MTYLSEIKLLSGNLEIGDTIRTVCPKCQGGSSKEKSLSITLSKEGMKWICFRAKCDVKGIDSTEIHGSTNVASKPTKPLRKRFTGKTQALSAEHLDRIQELWGITNPEHWYWTPDHGGRVAMSIRSPKYTHRGWLLRDIYNKHGAKALTYVDDDEEGLSWYKTTPAAPTVLVEDIPSALRAVKHLNSVALLGTGIGTARASEIATYAPRPIVVALDDDATELSFKWADRWGLFWDDPEVLVLDKDIKDCTDEEIKKLLKRYL